MRAFAQANHRHAVEVRCRKGHARECRYIGNQSDVDQRLRQRIEDAPGLMITAHRQADEDVRDLVLHDEPRQVLDGAENVEIAGPVRWLIYDETDVLEAEPARMPQRMRSLAGDATGANDHGLRLV